VGPAPGIVQGVLVALVGSDRPQELGHGLGPYEPAPDPPAHQASASGPRGGLEDGQAALPGSLGDRGEPGDEVGCRDRRESEHCGHADVVEAELHNDVRHPWRREHLTVEPGDPGVDLQRNRFVR
jgi:hypothetical protein